MVKVRSVRAFAIRSDMVGAHYKGGGAKATPLRRPAWNKDAEVASPLSGYPRFKRRRTSWRLDGPLGCLVTADDGTTGFGISRHGAPVIALVNDHFAPLLDGENALATERLWDLMTRAASPYGTSGLAAYAISAVDLALWDLKGKVLGLPVHELAGGPTRDALDCYATGNDTDWHMELGFRATKLACPFGPADGLDGLARNEAVVAAARETIGPGVELMLDCWLALDLDYAVRLAERLRPYGLRWMEDALDPEHMGAHAQLRQRLPWQPLATGEHWYTPAVFAQAAQAHLVDVFQPDIAWACGFTGCRRIDAIAAAHGIQLMLHAGMNTPYGQHFSFSSPNIRWGEYFVGSDVGVPLEDALVFPGMPVPEAGRIAPSGEPGFGLGLTEAALDAMRA